MAGDKPTDRNKQRINEQIRVSPIRVIADDGTQLGVISTDEALQRAREAGLDLVEVAPTEKPPVCRIMDFGKYVYEEQKKANHVKSTASKLKEIEFSARIADNDFHTKIRHAEEFLDKGNKVKLRLKFRGREMAHTEIGFRVITNALAELSGMGHADSEPRLLGKQINVMLTPHPPNKRKRKYAIEPDEEPIDDAGSSSDHDEGDEE